MVVVFLMVVVLRRRLAPSRDAEFVPNSCYVGHMLRWILLLSALALSCCRYSSNGPCPTYTKCVSHDQAWCQASTHIAMTADIDALDGGIFCQLTPNGHSLYVPFDAGVSGICPTPDQLNYSIDDQLMWGNDTGSQIDDQCCYLVGGGCA